MIGRVVSVKSKSTATVLVERQAISRLYGKTFVQSKKYLVEDPIGVKDGDMVEVEKCRPISKKKQWKINKVLGKNVAELAKAHLKKKGEEAIAEVMPEESVDQQVSKSVDQKTETPTHRNTDIPKKKQVKNKKEAK